MSARGLFSFFEISVLVLVAEAMATTSTRIMTFEKQVIEGKLKKPQVVLISSEQRPRFEPMAIELLKKSDEGLFPEVNEGIFESYQHKIPFSVKYRSF